jgi:uncharacterized membrane protein HdeD (DUF308 family)
MLIVFVIGMLMLVLGALGMGYLIAKRAEKISPWKIILILLLLVGGFLCIVGVLHNH